MVLSEFFSVAVVSTTSNIVFIIRVLNESIGT
jgi:hypothetical protein